MESAYNLSTQLMIWTFFGFNAVAFFGFKRAGVSLLSPLLLFTAGWLCIATFLALPLVIYRNPITLFSLTLVLFAEVFFFLGVALSHINDRRKFNLNKDRNKRLKLTSHTTVLYMFLMVAYLPVAAASIDLTSLLSSGSVQDLYLAKHFKYIDGGAKDLSDVIEAVISAAGFVMGLLCFVVDRST